jgi:hypothetical protein
MMYQKDGNGDWWYLSKRQRYRCKLYRCCVCDVEFPRLPTLVVNSKNVCCSRVCSNNRTADIHRVTRRGKGNPAWKGGRKFDSKGYVRIYHPDHPRCDNKGCVAEHRLVMEKKLGRFLLTDETVHHRNGIRGDNNLRNLELWTSSHPAGQKVEDVVIWAKQIIELYEAVNEK